MILTKNHGPNSGIKENTETKDKMEDKYATEYMDRKFKRNYRFRLVINTAETLLHSVDAGLLHNTKEFTFVNLTVAIFIELIDHSL